MDSVQSRLITRLVLDTMSCFQLAYPDVDGDRKLALRSTIWSLQRADMTDVEGAITLLRDVAGHLRAVERTLEAKHMLLTANKVRSVRERVEHAAAI
jgi:hypothetical protein